jgi:hypothetical protein
MVVGAVVGGLTGQVLEDEGRRSQSRDEELDREIGVEGGNLGAAGRTPAPAPAPAADDHDDHKVAGRSPRDGASPDADEDA